MATALPWVAGQASPATYLWQSLLCLLFLPPTAAVAIGYSYLVARREQAGDRTGAVRASRLARTWCFASLAAFAVVLLAAAAGMPV